MDRSVDIPYASLPFRDPFREFDLYSPLHSSTPVPVICFIHGGAWRAEDKADHRILAQRLASLTDFIVAVPNYRLTPINPVREDHIRHPSHAEDLLRFLAFLITWDGPHGQGPPPYDPRKIYLIGHSCSAHMLASIFLDSSHPTPSLTPPTSLFESVQAIVTSEGIFDLDLLLSSFPSYREFFVEAAFGSRESYAEFSTTTFSLRTSKPQMRWLVVHSKGDTLVDRVQSDAIYSHLCLLHTDAAARMVFRNVDQLDEEHNTILRGEHYVQIVGNFILEDHSRHFSL